MPPTTAKPQPPAQVAKGHQDMVLDDDDYDLDDGSTAGRQRSRSPVGRAAASAEAAAAGLAKKPGKAGAAGQQP